MIRHCAELEEHSETTTPIDSNSQEKNYFFK
jgi:hypothetical protein